METRTENTSEKTGMSGDGSSDAQVQTQDILNQFDDILGNNLKRLFGDSHGMESIPMNISTVSCLILLATRETEIEGFPFVPPGRYTRESLFNDLADMNVEHGGDLDAYINGLVEKGYIRIETDGRMFAGEPVMKLTVIFDKVFPKMPGLNLVAYLGQIIDEVLSNRKSLNTALSQFDQMLNLQGIPLKKNGDSTHGSPAKAFPHLRVSGETVQPVKRKMVTPDIRPVDIFSKLQTKGWTPSPPVGGTHAPSSDSAEELPEKTAPVDPHVTPPASTDAVKDIVERSQDMDIPVAQEGPVSGMDVSSDVPDTVKPDLQYEAPPALRGYDQDFDAEPEDDDVEKRIAAFEDDLSMKCPLCRVGKIVPNTTARGKAFYRCSNEECNFISWGKPYYITCPTCKNPFLIETPDSQGRMILKCPRTTCPHWQKFPWDSSDEHDMKSLAPEAPAEPENRPKRLVRRKKRVIVRRKG